MSAFVWISSVSFGKQFKKMTARAKEKKTKGVTCRAAIGRDCTAPHVSFGLGFGSLRPAGQHAGRGEEWPECSLDCLPFVRVQLLPLRLPHCSSPSLPSAPLPLASSRLPFVFVALTLISLHIPHDHPAV
jgi:hypothetical protein